MSLQIENVDINSILENPVNARIHDDLQLSQLAASFKKYGQRIPLVVSRKDRIVLVGNGRLRAMRDLLKWKTVDIVWSDLSSAESTEFAVADNALGARSEWDLNLLSSTVQEIFDLDQKFDWNLIGFTNDEIIPMLSNLTEENLLYLNVEEKPKKEELPDMGKSLKLTKDQREVVDQVILKIRNSENEPKLSEGRAIELALADWLSGS